MATWPAADASNGAIQTAINSASDGDTVTIPTDTKTWTGDVTIPNTKGITLQGAGEGSTVITRNGYTLNLQTSSSNSPLRVTGITWKTNASGYCIQITGSAIDWRLDNMTFDNQNNNSVYDIYIGDGSGSTNCYTYGLIDHCSFINRNYATSIFVEWPMAADSYNGEYIWTLAAQRGTAQAVYIEDCVFSGTGTYSQVVDCRWGAKYVLRYCTIHNPWISTHGGMTNYGRDPIWVEIYKNTLTDGTNYLGGENIQMRSVSGVVWDNDAAATLNSYGIGLDHERSYKGGSAPNAKCDGTRAYDENVGGTNGWRCRGQPGWGQPQEDDMSTYTFQGFYCWENRHNGVLSNLYLFEYDPDATSYQDTHLQAGREFFNQANMSIGPIASRPSSCSVGPPRTVYVSDDENSQGATLYVATGTNTWTQHWEPYTYPHPLQSGATEYTGAVTEGLQLGDTRLETGLPYRVSVADGIELGDAKDVTTPDDIPVGRMVMFFP